MTDIEKLATKEKKIRILAAVVPPVLLVVAFMCVSLASSESSKIATKRQELQTAQQTVSEAVAFNNYLTTNQEPLTRLNMVVPSEAMMIGVIRDFEAVVTKVDPQGTVQITSQSPTRVGMYLAIALSINCKTSLENLPVLLEQINQLPYIHQLLSSDTNQAGDGYTHQLSLRLYVQEPFNTP